MKLARLGLILAVGFVLVGAPACSRRVATTLSDVAVTTAVSSDNQATMAVSYISASAPVIYVSAQVHQPTRDTLVRVRWYRLPDTLIASEDFSGRRDSVRQFDFDRQVESSFLASRVDRPGLSWPIGEYRADLFLNNTLSTVAFFNVVSDAEAIRLNTQAMVRRISIGDALNTNFQVESDQTTLARVANTIYVQVDTRNVALGAELKVSVRYVREDRVFATFTTKLGDDPSPVFELSRERFGALWPDRLWPVGSFEVKVEIGGSSAATRTFTVQ